jgi:hypothetical protein
MSVWLGPDVLPVLVKSPDGVLSTPMMFTFVGTGTTVLLGEKKLQTQTPITPLPPSPPPTTNVPPVIPPKSEEKEKK